MFMMNGGVPLLLFATQLRLKEYVSCFFIRKLDNEAGIVFPIVVAIIMEIPFLLLLNSRGTVPL